MALDGYGASETQRLNMILERQSASMAVQDLRFLMDLADRSKPAGYQKHQELIRAFYDGCQAADTRRQIVDRYPIAAKMMSTVTINLVAEAADLDAQAYRDGVSRELLVSGAPAPDDARRDVFRAQLELSQIDSVMPELEKRLMASRTMFARFGWDDLGPLLGRPPRPTIDIFWPSQVWVIPCPDRRGALWAADAILVLVAGDELAEDCDPAPGPTQQSMIGRLLNPVSGRASSGRVFQIWTRRRTLDDSGRTVAFGRWLVEEISEEGDSTQAEEWPLTNHPFVALHDGLSDSIFHDVDRDLVEAQRSQNVGLSNFQYLVDVQGHTDRWVSGRQSHKGAAIVGGPAAWIELEENARVGTLAYNLSDVGLSWVEKFRRMLGASRRLPPRAFSTEPGPPLSGVAMAIQDAPATQKREERKALYRAVEQSELLPRLVEVSDHFGAQSIGKSGGDDVTYRVRFPKSPQIEDPTQRGQRAAFNEDRGYWSQARAAAEADAYASEQEAIDAGLSTELVKPTGPGPSE